MKSNFIKFVTAALLLLITMPVPSFAAETITIEGVLIPVDTREKYEYLANSFGRSIIPKEYDTGDGVGETWTPVICYDVFGTQIGFFTNGFIVTFLTGENEGKQIVVYRDRIIGISYPSSKNRNQHVYIWGSVSTSYHEVTVFINDQSEFLELL